MWIGSKNKWSVEVGKGRNGAYLYGGWTLRKQITDCHLVGSDMVWRLLTVVWRVPATVMVADSSYQPISNDMADIQHTPSSYTAVYSCCSRPTVRAEQRLTTGRVRNSEQSGSSTVSNLRGISIFRGTTISKRKFIKKGETREIQKKHQFRRKKTLNKKETVTVITIFWLQVRSITLFLTFIICLEIHVFFEVNMHDLGTNRVKMVTQQMEILGSSSYP